MTILFVTARYAAKQHSRFSDTGNGVRTLYFTQSHGNASLPFHVSSGSLALVCPENSIELTAPVLRDPVRLRIQKESEEVPVCLRQERGQKVTRQIISEMVCTGDNLQRVQLEWNELPQTPGIEDDV